MGDAQAIRSQTSAATAQDISAALACPIDVLTGRWWLIHTKSRCEKALAADLDRLGIGYFLPLGRMRRRHGGRPVEVLLPLFPSYLFLCGGDDERYATLMTHRAAQVIEVADQDRLKLELRQIHRVVVSREPVELYPGLSKGVRCRVLRGPLTGLEGVVLRRDTLRQGELCRVYVGVEALGQSAELQIDAALLEAVD